jgi:hypothetical protein
MQHSTEKAAFSLVNSVLTAMNKNQTEAFSMTYKKPLIV